jgi:hypothetical protein
MRKNYQILLCESFYENETFIEKPVCEVGSSTSTFSGQAYNVEFYTKIDGTHQLTFNLPRYYYDEYTGERVKNNLVELIVNKSRLEVTKTNRDGQIKTFYMIVNSRKDKEEKGVFSYEYSCGDAYIEELGKNGYSVVFDDDVEGNGLGDIHHFAREVAKSSGWEYNEEKTGLLREYTTEMEWNVGQSRYDEVKRLVPVNEIEYIPELERYCYKTVLARLQSTNGTNYLHDIYCYDDSKTITNSAVKNMLYNGDDFTDTVGWTAWKRDGEKNKECWTIESVKAAVGTNENEYYMKVTTKGEDKGKLLNDTCAETTQQISADTPYIFRYDAEKNGGYIKKLSIYSKNPLANYGIAPDYELSLSNGVKGAQGIVVKSRKSFSTPFFVFELDGDIEIKSIEFFPLQGTTDENNLTLLKNYTNGELFNESEDIFIAPNSSTFEAYTEHKMQYFIRDNYCYSIVSKNGNYTKNAFVDLNKDEETVTYFDFEKEINIDHSGKDNPIYISDSNGSASVYSIFTGRSIKEVDNLNNPPTVEGENTIDTTTIFQYEGRYYQYYHLPAEGGFRAGGAWDYALLGSGKNGKRRTYSVSKSNHFNIIQDIAELFKVWPVFETTRGKNGIIRKQFYFKEEALKENFSGFHRGINLVDLTRRMDSENIVTKIYVEDQENQHAKDGFVTIRTSKFNPWGENYYYNFQYYVNQQLMNVTDNGTPLVERDMKILYSEVKGLNNEIYKLNTENADLIVEIKNLKNRQKTLTLQIAGQEERIASSQADLDATKSSDTDKKLILGPTDIQTLNDNISAGKDNIKKWEDELSSVTLQLKELQDRYDGNKTTVEKNQKNKENLIDEFESKYRPYIKEGVWFDNSYIENDAYFIDSQKVMNTSSKPQLEWTINVIDGSIATELENFEFEVGDKTILVDNEFFGIEKNGEENYVFEVLISGIKEGLDDATKNTIEVRNYNTSFEELFERISAATQTLELNEQTYNKSAYFTSDGELSADILQKTLIQNSLILANASDNSYILDNSGLTLRSILNPRKQLRLIAEGLFLSNSTNLATGAPEWKTGITADGISASLLTAGEINTANIKIFSDAQPSQSWNKLGITSYRVIEDWKEINGEQTLVSKEIDSTSFVRLDQFGLYLVEKSTDNWHLDGAGNAWFEGLSRKDAIQQIKDNATVSITEDGFKYNFDLETSKTTNKGAISIGYLDKDEGIYGIQVKKGSDIVAQFDNSGTSTIGGFSITKERISSLYEIDGAIFEGGMNSTTVALSNLDFSEDILYPVFYVRTNLLEGLPGLSEKDNFSFIVDAFGNVDCGGLHASNIKVSEIGGTVRTPNLNCDYLTFDIMTSNSAKDSPIEIEKNYLKIGSTRADGDLEINLSSNRIGFTSGSTRIGWMKEDKIAYKSGYFGSWTDAASTLTTGVWLGKSASNTPLIQFYSKQKNIDDLVECSGGMGFSKGAKGQLVLWDDTKITIEGGLIRTWKAGSRGWSGTFYTGANEKVTITNGIITDVDL